MKIELENGKYTYINDEKGQRALRYGEEWRDLVGDNLVLAMAQKIEELNEEYDDLLAKVEALGIDLDYLDMVD